VSREPGDCVDARAALLELAAIQDEPYQIQIGFHIGTMIGEATLVVGLSTMQRFFNRVGL
jgi:hypothetical protein